MIGATQQSHCSCGLVDDSYACFVLCNDINWLKGVKVYIIGNM